MNSFNNSARSEGVKRTSRARRRCALQPLSMLLKRKYNTTNSCSQYKQDSIVNVDTKMGLFVGGRSGRQSPLPPAPGALPETLKGEESIEDPKRYLAESLGNMCRQWPDVVPARVAALEPPHRHALQTYLNAYSNAMLGVFQKLIASKTNDHEGFYLVQTMLYKFGSSVMDQYSKQIITLLFQRLSSSKTTKYVRGLIAFLGFYAAHFGADTLVNLIDSVQANMFAMYTERILIAELQRVSGALERKAAAVGCVKLLCESEHFRTGALAALWPKLLQVQGTTIFPYKFPALNRFPFWH
ncbi:Exportin-2 [Papilio xuthus]|uniref:Exportin-2 n=1 Tax=Papilio xuthus TaxID=66420 RepID=A0A0N1I3S7_PAPXU|nr:Exportin-2 [Papilio xuthus]